jgi:hypothetical protein
MHSSSARGSNSAFRCDAATGGVAHTSVFRPYQPSSIVESCTALKKWICGNLPLTVRLGELTEKCDFAGVTRLGTDTTDLNFTARRQQASILSAWESQNSRSLAFTVLK